MQAHTFKSQWPTKNDYDIAMDDFQHTLLPSDLRRGQLAKNNSGILRHMGLPDSCVCLYRIDNWMVRCFCTTDDKEPPEDIAERYSRFSRFCQDNLSRVSALIPVHYIQEGIRVDYFKPGTYTIIDTKTVPIVTIPFINAPLLGSFVAVNHQNPHTMNLLCEAWLRMIQEMEAVSMAHGDLDLTNVLVQYESASRQIQLKLIDYDNTWIPGFDYSLPEHGHEPFQHPDFFGKGSRFNATIDRFASLTIYISLKALTAYPTLYQDWGVDETHLLFTPSDYKDEQRGSSKCIAQLRSMRIPDIEPYLSELSRSLHQSCMPDSICNISLPAHPGQDMERKPTFQPGTKYREVILTDWDHAEYFDQNNPLRIPISSSPRVPEPRQAQEGPIPPVRSPERHIPPPVNPVERPVPPVQSAKQQEQLHLISSTSSASPYEPTVFDHEYHKEEALDARRHSKQRNTFSDPATLVGCAVTFIVLVIIILLVILLWTSTHAH